MAVKGQKAQNVTRWWIIRHAPVIAEFQGHLNGRQTNVPADTSDRAPFHWLATHLPENPLWVATPLRRTTETAFALAEAAAMPTPNPQIESDLAEQDYGEWEGKSWGALQKAWPDQLADFWTDPGRKAPPGGEGFHQVLARVGPAMDRLSEQHAGRDIIACVHAGTQRAALAHALKLDPTAAISFATDNLSLTRIDRITGGWADGWRVVVANATMKWA